MPQFNISVYLTPHFAPQKLDNVVNERLRWKHDEWTPVPDAVGRCFQPSERRHAWFVECYPSMDFSFPFIKSVVDASLIEHRVACGVSILSIRIRWFWPTPDCVSRCRHHVRRYCPSDGFTVRKHVHRCTVCRYSLLREIGRDLIVSIGSSLVLVLLSRQTLLQ